MARQGSNTGPGSTVQGNPPHTGPPSSVLCGLFVPPVDNRKILDEILIIKYLNVCFKKYTNFLFMAEVFNQMRYLSSFPLRTFDNLWKLFDCHGYAGGLLVACSEWGETKDAANILQCKGQSPRQKGIWSEMSMVPWLRELFIVLT